MARTVRCYRSNCYHIKRRYFRSCEGRHFILGLGRRSPASHPYKRATLQRNRRRRKVI